MSALGQGSQGARGRGFSSATRGGKPAYRGRGRNSKSPNPPNTNDNDTKPTTNGFTRGRGGGVGSGARGGQVASRGSHLNFRAGLKGVGRGGRASSENTPAAGETWRLTENAGKEGYRHRMEKKLEELEKRRDQDIEQAINENKMTAYGEQRRLDQAIPKYGTCQDMCPEFERVRRIVLKMVDPCEKIKLPDGTDVPCEEKMVKIFKRSAAEKVEEPPWELLGPDTALKTLNYLMDDVLGSGMTPSVHKFLWDRTRLIRSELNMQLITDVDDIAKLIECYEVTARFHIFSLHFWANPEEAEKYPSWSRQQEHEQMTATFSTLERKYADYRDKYTSNHEQEMLAYSAIFSLQHDRQRLEYHAQKMWRSGVMETPKIRLAFDILSAARHPDMPVGPSVIGHGLPALDRSNYMTFWTLVSQPKTPFLMACAAEYFFNDVRRMALAAMRKAYNRPKVGAQDDLVMSDVAKMLGFDTEDQAIEYCEAHELTVDEKIDGNAFLDIRAWPNTTGELPTLKPGVIKNPYSWNLVEKKRRGRAPTAIVKGLSFGQAKAQGLVDEDSQFQQLNGVVKETTAAPGNPFLAPDNALGSNSLAPNSFGQPNSTSGPSPFAPTGSAAGSNVFGEPGVSALSPFAKPGDTAAFNPFGQPKAPADNPFAKPGDTNPFLKSTTGPSQSIVQKSPFAPLDGTSLQPPQFNPQPPSTSPIGTATGQTQSLFQPVATKVGEPNACAVPPSFGVSSFTPATSQNPLISQTQPSTSLFEKPTFTPSTSQSQTAALKSPFGPPRKDSVVEDEQPLFVPEDPLAGSTSISFPANLPSTVPDTKTTQSSITPTNSFFPATPQQQPPDAGLPATRSAQTEKKSLFAPFPAIPNTSTTTGSTLKFPFPIPQAPAPTTSQPSQPPPTSLFQPPAAAQHADATTDLSSNSQLKPSTTPSFFVRDVKPLQAPLGVQKPPSPPPRPSRKELLTRLAKATLLGPGGLMGQFLEHEIGNTIKSCQRKVARERERARVAEARRFLLSRKYIRRWRDLAWKGTLRRRAKKRRTQFAESMRQMAIKSRENSKAASASPGPHFEPFTSLTGRTSDSTMQPPPKPILKKDHRASLPASAKLQQAGVETQANMEPTERKSKRRSVLGPRHPALSADVTNAEVQASFNRPRASTSISLIGESFHQTERLMKEASRLVKGRTDTTRSDYFKLKSLGIDPNTPIVPKTQTRKRANEDDFEDLARKSRVSPAKRPSGTDVASLLPAPVMPAPVNGNVDSSGAKASAVSKPVDDDEDFFAQIAAVKQRMAEDTAWFRDTREQSERSSLERATETEKQRKVREWKPSANRTEARWKREGLPSFLRAPWTPRETVSRSASRMSDAQPVAAPAEDNEHFDEDEDEDEETEGDDGQYDDQDVGYMQDDDDEEMEEEYGENYEDEEDYGYDTQVQAFQAVNHSSAFASKGASADDAIEL